MKPGTFSDEELRRQFFTALPDTYRHHMATSVKTYTTTDEGTCLEKMQEAVILLHQSLATAKTISGDHNSADNQDKSSQRQVKWNKRQKGMPSKAGRPAVPPTPCHFCPGEFHWQNECPKRANGQAPPLRERLAKPVKTGKPFGKSSTPNTGKDLSKVKCYKCGKFGHYKTDCTMQGNGGAALNTLKLKLARQGKMIKELKLSSLASQGSKATPSKGTHGRKRGITAWTPSLGSSEEDE
jgi:hypothetical protein